MLEFLSSWGAEIILSLIIAVITYHYNKSNKEKERQVEHYQKLLKEEETEKTQGIVEAQLEPIYKELEDIRKRILSMQDKEEKDTDKLRDNMDLIIASYKYRLVQLCREFLNQGFMYQQQYEDLNEFFNLYTSLGGNGQAKSYYDKVVNTLEIKANPSDHT